MNLQLVNDRADKSEARFSVFSIHVCGITFGLSSCVRTLESYGDVCPASPHPNVFHSNTLLYSNHSIPAFIVLYNRDWQNIALYQKKNHRRKFESPYSSQLSLSNSELLALGKSLPVLSSFPHPQNEIAIFSTVSQGPWDDGIRLFVLQCIVRTKFIEA